MITEILIGGSLLVGAVVMERVYINVRAKRSRQTYRYARLLPSISTAAQPELVFRMIANLHEYRRTHRDQARRGREWFRYLIHKDPEGNLALYFGYPEDRQSGIKRALRNVYPELDIMDLQHDEVPLALVVEETDGRGRKKKRTYGGYFTLNSKGDKEGFALKPYQGGTDLEDLLYGLDAGTAGTESWFDVMISPVSNREIQKRVSKSTKAIQRRYGVGTGAPSSNPFAWSALVDAFYNSGSHKKAAAAKQKQATPKKKVAMTELDPDDKERIRMMNQRFTGRETAFCVGIRMLVHAEYADSIGQTAAAAVKTGYLLDNGLRFVRNKVKESMLDFAPIPPRLQQVYMTGEELANVFRLPDGGHRIYKHVPHLAKGQSRLDDDELAEGISLGKMVHPAFKGRQVKVPLSQYTRHYILSGMTGAGKSSALVEMLESVIQMWMTDPAKAPGFTFFDPAQETVATILNRLRHYERIGGNVDWSRVHYYNFTDSQYVLPLNLLHRRQNESVSDLSDEVFSQIQSLYGGGPQMDRILRNALITLISDTSQVHNLLGIIPLLMDERFRNRIVPRVSDPIIRQFWMKEFPELSKKLDQAVGPLLNRLSPFQTNEKMRRMFGQPGMGLSIKKWMDEGHIILFDLKGASNQTIDLAGGFVANQYHKEAQGRGTGSRVHLLTYDEAHRTQYPVMNKIFAEDRKFGLSLGLSTQFIDQLNGEIVNSIIGIVNNIFTTAQGYKTAGIIQQMTAGRFDRAFLQQLPERMMAVYTKVKEDGVNTAKTVVVQCDPPYVYKVNGTGEWANHENEDEMQAAFRWGLERGRELMARDCVRAEEVDDMIEQYITTGTVLQEKRRQAAAATSEPAEATVAPQRAEPPKIVRPAKAAKPNQEPDMEPKKEPGKEKVKTAEEKTMRWDL